MGNVTELKQGNLDGIKRQLSECIDNVYVRGLKAGRGLSTDNESYRRGIEDLWKAYSFLLDSGANVRAEVVGAGRAVSDFVNEIGPVEFINRVNEYIHNRLHVGDEILLGHTKLVVIGITTKSTWTIDEDGKIEAWKASAELPKTGRHFDEIKSLLAMLSQDED